ncbi:MAG TPA: hypothetical protein PLI51_03160 [bacterium]|nr:hypothetical protein [bacterium]HPQ65717.1 hypothetical protein [bacterium]
MKTTGKLSCLTPGDGQYFFGYYDLCPWNRDESKTLALRTDFLDRLPEAGDEAEVLILEQGHAPRRVARTRAWNWQLGARLQWLPASRGEEIVFNTLDGTGQRAEILDPATGERRSLPLPVFTVAPDGSRALSLNFQALKRLRPSYGYPGTFDAGEEDGIFSIDIRTGARRCIVPLDRLRSWGGAGSARGREDWVNHILIAPGGKRFCFLHRWSLPGGGVYSRLFAADMDGGNLACLLDSGNVTHCGWRNDRELAAWGRLPGATTAVKRNRFLSRGAGLLLPLYRRLAAGRRGAGRDAYILLSDPGGPVGPVGEGLFPGDGHCSFSPDGRWMLTDTYPDPDHRRRLLLYDLDERELSRLGTFSSLPSPRFRLGPGWDTGGSRCDLHPRWNRAGTGICFDSVHEGERRVYRLDLEFGR